MYLLQNRSEGFIRHFEAVKNRSFKEIFNLYRLAYANKLMLGIDSWVSSFLSDVEKMRKENKVILDYLASKITIPDNASSG